eukprot:TRINITY_DN269_c0_g2_i1.p1 TRINITY_DN269_c0_g2~~TRINITY_DN269_c0_g2_i1.p1  ORF type:complete len:306 (-),score=63.27 TRINITY_DN269_c0_g2_i1:25-942(-)
MQDQWIAYSKREEWKDVKGVPQDDGPDGGVCAIVYTPKFKETMDYFRAICQSNEVSQRAYMLVGDVIKMNAANYSAWFYRRSLVDALKIPVEEELAWTTQIALDNPKNYQIWYHRRALVEKSRDVSKELDFTEKMLLEDNKNYHSWSHRQWVLDEFDLWKGELAFIDKLLKIDLRNNSAWNQRFFVIAHTEKLDDLAVIKREMEYSWQYINRSPNNQSAWNYLRGICRGAGNFSKIEGLKKDLLAFRKRIPTCAHVVSFLVDVYEQENNLSEAAGLCEVLATSLAQMHSKYWFWKADQLTKTNGK